MGRRFPVKRLSIQTRTIGLEEMCAVGNSIPPFERVTCSLHSALSFWAGKKVERKSSNNPHQWKFFWRMELYPSIKAPTNTPKSASVSMSVLAIVLILVSA